jgi:lysophospholipase L1-like esterase
MKRLVLVLALLAAALTPAVTVQAAVTPWPPTVHNTPPATRWCADIAAGRGMVLLLGDSIMTDVGASSAALGWPQQLKTWATGRWHVLIDGARGNSTAGDYAPGGQHAWITEWARAQVPSVVVLDWRSNEQSLGVSPSQMRTHYNAIIAVLRSWSANTSILIVNPPSSDHHPMVGTSPYPRSAYVDALRQVQADHNTMWLDLQPFFPLTDPRSAALLPDRIHPGDNGHTAMAVGVQTALLGACDGT